jgi:hypothetical protein
MGRDVYPFILPPGMGNLEMKIRKTKSKIHDGEAMLLKPRPQAVQKQLLKCLVACVTLL